MKMQTLATLRLPPESLSKSTKSHGEMSQAIDASDRNLHIAITQMTSMRGVEQLTNPAAETGRLNR